MQLQEMDYIYKIYSAEESAFSLSPTLYLVEKNKQTVN